MKARPAHPAIQGPGRGENAVANRFRFQTPRRKPPQEAAPGIDACGILIRPTGLLEGLRVQHQSQRLLHRPAIRHKLCRQPIQQLGMSRNRSIFPKIARGIHQARSENELPQAVHRHARGERMIRLRDPVCQGHPPFPLRCIHGKLQAPNDLQGIRWNGLPLRHGIAPVEPMSRPGLRKVRHPRLRSILQGCDSSPQRSSRAKQFTGPRCFLRG